MVDLSHIFLANFALFRGTKQTFGGPHLHEGLMREKSVI